MENELRRFSLSPQNNEAGEEEVEEEVEEENEEDPKGESEKEPEADPSADPKQKEDPKPNKDEESPEAKHARLKRQLERHEKKHGIKKPDAPAPKSNAQSDALDLKDTLAIMNAKVHPDDVDSVVEYAKFAKLSVAKALESDVLKATLAIRSEKRATAEATNTGRSRPNNQKPSGSALLEKAEKAGELPSDPKELDALIQARLDEKANDSE